MKILFTALLTFLFSLNSNAQNSLNMNQLGHFFPAGLTPGVFGQFNDVWGYAAPDGREYALLGSSLGTYFVDVTNPSNPVNVDFESGGPSTFWRDYKTYDHYVFAVSDANAGSLQIFDLQFLPDSVHKIYDNNQFSKSAHNIFINNDRLYLIANMRGNTYYPLDVLCIEDPYNPFLIGTITNDFSNPNPVNPHDAFARNDTLYLSSGFDGFRVYDFTDAGNWNLVSTLESYPGNGYNHANWMNSEGNYMVMADETHGSPVKVINIQDVLNPVTVSTFQPDTGSIAHNPTVLDCMAIVSYYHLGVQIYDISNPASPNRIGYFKTDTTIAANDFSGFQGCWGVYPFLPSGNILASDRTTGLHILSFTGTAPSCSGNYDRVVEMDTSKYCTDTTTSALRDYDLESIEIYPNPVDDVILIKIENAQVDDLSIRIMNIHGETLKTKFFLNESLRLNVKDLKPGLFLYEIRYDNQNHKGKFIKL